jgi:Zn-dependent peptidase ImmA (M78 family)
METDLIKVIEEYKVESVFELADVLGVSVRYDILPKEIDGLYYINEEDNEIIIVINKDANKQLQLYICAYLLSHHALDRGTYFCFLDKNSSNNQYYILALQLLRATVGKASVQERLIVLS